MGKYSVPEEIRKLKPRGTMVKAISGHYYVYEFKTVRDSEGKRHTKMGRALGSIKAGVGFVPNNSFLHDAEITTLEFGDYMVVVENTKKVLDFLREYLNPLDAVRIYLVALIHYVQGYTYEKDIQAFFAMSILSLMFPDVKLGYDVVSQLYDDLGRKQDNILKIEEKLVEKCSREVAIDGHVMASCSQQNDLAGIGSKFGRIGEPQVNLLMAYDVNTGKPLLSRFYDGAAPDKSTVKNLMNEVRFKDTLFVVDRGFYSESNLSLFSSSGNSYIIPLASSQRACKKAVSEMNLRHSFAYMKSGSVVEYKDEIIDGRRVITYRDLKEAEAELYSYQKKIAEGHPSYTEKRISELRDFLGVTVLQTNVTDKPAEEIYTLYKKRWSIETFFNYLKNKEKFKTLYQQDYYKTQGLSFVMLVSALIHREFSEAVRNVKGKNVHDCLLEARMVKADKRHGKWVVSNCLKKQRELFQTLGTPLEVKAAT